VVMAYRSSRSPSPVRRTERGRSPPRRSSRSPPRQHYFGATGQEGGGRGGGGMNYFKPRNMRNMGTERDRTNSTTLFVGNLPHHYREKDIIDTFERCGRLKSVTIGINKRSGQSGGYAFVEFDDRRDAEEAFEKFSGFTIEGRKLRLDWDIGLDKKQTYYGFQKQRGGGGGDRGGFGPGKFYSPPNRYSYGGGGGRGMNFGSRRSPSPRGGENRRSPMRRTPSPRRDSDGGGRGTGFGPRRSPSPRGGENRRSPIRRSPSPRREIGGDRRGISPGIDRPRSLSPRGRINDKVSPRTSISRDDRKRGRSPSPTGSMSEKRQRIDE